MLFISMLKSRMPITVALIVMVLLIISAHFAAGEKILLHVREEKHRLQFLT